MSSTKGIDFCVYLSERDITKLLSTDEQREAYEEYKATELELANATSLIDKAAATEKVFKVCSSIRTGGWFEGNGLLLHRMFVYRQLFLTVNYNLSKKYQDEMKLTVALYNPEIGAVSEILMSQS